jgi:hypothetical protein
MSKPVVPASTVCCARAETADVTIAKASNARRSSNARARERARRPADIRAL